MVRVNYPWPGCEEWESQWPTFSMEDVVRQHAHRDGDKVAVIDARNDTSVTYAELDRMADELAAGLSRAGLKAGGTLAVQLPNWWEFVALYLAAERLRAVFCPLSPAYRESEVAYMLARSEAAVVVYQDSYRGFDYTDMVERVRATCPQKIAAFVVASDPGAGRRQSFPSFDDLREPGIEIPAAPFDRHSPAFILFTSGSEAAPKAVVHTHATANYSLTACTDLWGVEESDVVLVAAPISHGAGFNWCLRIALYAGASQVLVDRWDPSSAAELIAKRGCSFTYAPTRFLQDLLGVAPDHPDLTMKTFASGGSPIPRHFVALAKELMDCQVLATYGQTECFVATSTRLGDSMEKISSSDGCAVPGAQVRIVDESSTEVPRGDEGICVTRGPHVGAGYLDETGVTRPFADDGWLWTGDVCIMDDEGYIRVVGRQKEVVIRNGLNISPAEIETHLLKYPGVVQAAVVGYPDDDVGERICAAVVMEGGAHVSVADFASLLEREGIAKYKFPEIVVEVDELPHSTIGKLQRREVRQRLVEQAAART
jgi:acyl-CoA synthetase (AMP-forming)/AMP-acid ligase II